MRASIHITTRDRPMEIVTLLHVLRFQIFQDWDVYVLDDASKQPLVTCKQFNDVFARLKLEGHDVHLARNDNSMGVCKARQQMVDQDPWKNPLILRLDDDVIPEPEYIEKLAWLINKEGAGIASGLTPLFAQPEFERDSAFIKPVINRIEFDKEGNITKYADDCGYSYWSGEILLAHQFRSNALMKREMFDKGIKYEEGLSMVGFREEAFLSLRAAYAGYKCMVDNDAIAWHAPSQAGGCRWNDYQACVQRDNERWLKTAKELFQKNKGVPTIWTQQTT